MIGVVTEMSGVTEDQSGDESKTRVSMVIQDREYVYLLYDYLHLYG